ncbi:Protein CBG17252 [Caenorhabditis briggsae]|nr:Protein CBG17252 [Caenorhabditis briggsae]ULT81424.1 hypothetical protein L3Y34_011372 [Caenorhabditis briggsae]CAP34898.2 Protein CBG17252 [Caenorhabditis briggsae]
MAIKEIGGTQYYMIHYRRRKKTTDIRIPIGEENGRMFNGTLKEYGDKFNVEISSDAWEAEKKDKRKAVDDLETSLEKKGELWRRIHMSYSVFFK